MHQIIQTQGIVLSKFPFGDYDTFYTLFSQDFGRISFFAKSSRKPKAKLGAHLEPGSISQVSFVPRKKQDDYLLTGALLFWKPNFLELSTKQNQLFMQAINLTSRLIKEDTLDQQVISYSFQLLKDYLKKIVSEKLSAKKIILLRLSFILKLLDYAGFCPNFKNCLVCGKKISEKSKLNYDPNSGGVVCCVYESHFLKINDITSLKLANFLKKEPLSKAERLNVNAKTIKETWKILLNHLKYCLE